jgi:Ca2+-binding RTX toxin-like protein
VTNVNEAPADITVSGGSVLENSAAGTVVATLGATDPDGTGSFTYSLASDPSGFFAVTGNQLTLASGAAIDYESATSHAVTLKVTGAGGLSYQKDVVIAGNVSGHITGTNAAETLTGTSEEDTITALAGNDTLIGGAGIDTLIGGLGNDTYVIADVDADYTVELAGQGTDTVQLAPGFYGAAYHLQANVENLAASGSLPVALYGNGLDNRITGNAGDNVLDGGAGSDTMTGGAGDDIYCADDSGDKAVEMAGGGTDEVRTGLTGFSLASFGNVEKLTYTGGAAFTGTGNSLANTITGGSGIVWPLIKLQAIMVCTMIAHSSAVPKSLIGMGAALQGFAARLVKLNFSCLKN